LLLVAVFNMFALFFMSYLHLHTYEAMTFWGLAVYFVWRILLEDDIPITSKPLRGRVACCCTASTFAASICDTLLFGDDG